MVSLQACKCKVPSSTPIYSKMCEIHKFSQPKFFIKYCYNVGSDIK